MSKLEKYPSYKESGVEWLGEIPEHWELKPLRSIFEERNEKNVGIKTDYILSVTKDRGVIPYDEKGAIGNNKSEDIEKYKLVYPNDFVINKMNVVIGSLGISKYYGAFSHVYLVYKEKSKNININYTAYVFSNQNFYKSLIKICTGIMELRESLNKDEFKKILLPIPPHNEQQRIIAYLDEKTAQIDEAISQKQKLIELLKERRQIVINDAVTKGLDKTIEFVDSGIEWIGEIPKGWEVKKIKYFSYTKGRIGFHGLKSDEFLYDSGAYLITGTDFKNKTIDWNSCRRVTEKRYEEDANIHIQEDDFLITKDGTIGKTAIVKNMPYKTTLNSGVLLVRTQKYICKTEFLYWIINSNIFKIFIDLKNTGATVLHLYQNDFNNFDIPIPPQHEQLQIVQYIETQTTKIDKAIELQQNYIAKLKEYKASLIDSVVTGKVRVS